LRTLWFLEFQLCLQPPLLPLASLQDSFFFSSTSTNLEIFNIQWPPSPLGLCLFDSLYLLDHYSIFNVKSRVPPFTNIFSLPHIQNQTLLGTGIGSIPVMCLSGLTRRVCSHEEKACLGHKLSIARFVFIYLQIYMLFPNKTFACTHS
jgi:hypothetical protein